MSSAEVQSVFDLEEEHNPYSYQAEESIASQQNLNNLSTESPGNFLNNLQAKPESPAAISDNPSITIDPLNSSNQLKQPEFMPAISPSMMLSSMASSSPAAENILSSAKERISQIRPWKDFFALDQFRIPESSTAAQSRVSHNFTHFQNNYLVIILLLTGFSLLSDFTLLMVAALILAGLYFISTLKPEFSVKIGNQEITAKQINYGWIAFSVILLYMSSALSAVFWIISISGIISISHAALHDISIENEFNSV